MAIKKADLKAFDKDVYWKAVLYALLMGLSITVVPYIVGLLAQSRVGAAVTLNSLRLQYGLTLILFLPLVQGTVYGYRSGLYRIKAGYHVLSSYHDRRFPYGLSGCS